MSFFHASANLSHVSGVKTVINAAKVNFESPSSLEETYNGKYEILLKCPMSIPFKLKKMCFHENKFHIPITRKPNACEVLKQEHIM